MSDILKAVREHIEPFVPMANYSDNFKVRRSSLRPDDPSWCDDDGEHDFGPTVEVLYPDGYMMECVTFNVGAVIIMQDDDIWVERNTTSGKPHGNLYVDPADPKSLDKIVKFLT